MYAFDHPNVLKLLGVCMDGGSAPFIIMPFMANGNLKDYLINERENILLAPNSIEPDSVVNYCNIGAPVNSMLFLTRLLLCLLTRVLVL